MPTDETHDSRVDFDRKVETHKKELAEYFVSAPLYKRLEVSIDTTWATRFLPTYPRSLQYHCGRCATTTTHLHQPAPKDAAALREEGFSLRFMGDYMFIPYQCGNCGDHEFVVLVRFIATRTHRMHDLPVSYPTAGYYTKIGQWPPFNKSASPELRSALSKEHVRMYEKGLMNLSASYGLGAVTYFRRIVEDTIEELLDLVQEAATENSEAATIEAIKKARREKRTDVRLELISDSVPTLLKQGGDNPLKVLHDEYSAGLHGRSEEEVLESASRLRAALELTFRLLKSHKKDLAELRKLMSGRRS